MVSYEIAMGFCFLIVLMVSASLNLSDIVAVQGKGQFAQMGLNFLSWNWLPLLPVFVVYFVSSLAETNRIPFDVIEGEAEIVAGHMVEYSGMSWALFQMAEYANIWLVSVLATRSLASGTTRSCVWAGKCSFRSRWFGWWLSERGCRRPGTSGINSKRLCPIQHQALSFLRARLAFP